MSESIMHFDLPKNKSSIIKVMGVGGGGSNAVNHMYKQGITDVDFVICNTDSQDLAKSPVPVKIQLGESLTGGRGAGNKPEKGRQAAIESVQDVNEVLGGNTKMVFITAGMGGGTGTGAAPVIAEEAQKMGLLTVGIVTIPFLFEGKKRINQAIEGIEKMKEYVDSLLVINNEKLREMYGDLKYTQAFARADDVLTVAAKGIAEIITKEGNVNVDFEDVQTVMSKSGVALMGSATAEGEDRAIKAIEDALSSPLLNNNNIDGATNLLINITSGSDEITMDEIGQITDYVQDAAGQNADMIWGVSNNNDLGDKVMVTVIATGFDTDVIPEIYARRATKVEKVQLETEEEPISTSNSTTYVLDENEEDATISSETKIHELDMDEEDAENAFETDFTFVPVEKDPPKKEEKQEQTGQGKKISYIRGARNIEELEEVPAFIRRKKKIDVEVEPENDEVSEYTLDDDENGPEIRSGNSYLDKNVD